MSWRLLLFTLLLMAGAATLGGLYAGDWLVEHAPKQAKIKIMSENDPAPAVASDGTPILRQPAQPLINGTLGVPDDNLYIPILWQISRNNISGVETDDMGNSNFLSTRPVISDTVTTSSTSRIISTRPIGSTIPEAPTGASGWLAEFNQRMRECRQLAFGKRGECVRETRNYYCGNHNAWGQLADCPAY